MNKFKLQKVQEIWEKYIYNKYSQDLYFEIKVEWVKP